jgi:Zn-dependent M28 family amino/carboxypeptidase
MIRNSARLVVLLTALLWVPVAWGDTIANVVAQVSQASYSNYLNSLFTHIGNDRNQGTADYAAAQAYIQGRFSSFGLTTSLDSFPGYSNVVAVKPGSVHPNNIYIIGGHYDSVGNVSFGSPGADDDASGVAGVLEAARVLSQHTFEDTLVFIAFDGEEDGLLGSFHYASAHSTDNILGMISLDMIAYNPGGTNNATVGYRSTNTPLTTELHDILENLNLYGYTNMAAWILGGIGGSDHTPFEIAGKPAALLIELDPGSNPNYHQPTDSVDTVGYIDYAFATNMTRGVVIYLATEANLLSDVPEPGSLTLIGIGLVCVLAAARRRRKGRP